MRRAALLALALSLAACTHGGGEGGGRIERSALERIVLQPEDLGAGFQSFGDDPAGGPDAAERRRHKGYEAGWTTRYRRTDPAAAEGPLVVVSMADLFAGDSASDYFDFVSEQLRKGIPGGPAATAVDAPALGDESLVVRLDQAPARFVIVLWREANVAAQLTVQGRADGLEVEHALRLARAQARRMKAAVRG